MGKEMIGRILMVISTVMALQISWWAPLVVCPVVFRSYNLFFNGRIYDENNRTIMDLITHISYIGYIILCIAQFARNTGEWYWGLIIGFIVVQLFGLLWPRRWFYENLDKKQQMQQGSINDAIENLRNQL